MVFGVRIAFVTLYRDAANHTFAFHDRYSQDAFVSVFFSFAAHDANGAQFRALLLCPQQKGFLCVGHMCSQAGANHRAIQNGHTLAAIHVVDMGPPVARRII